MFNLRMIPRYNQHIKFARNAVSKSNIQQRRSLSVPSGLLKIPKLKTMFGVMSGLYIGVTLVSLGSFYFIYSDANSRQSIPWELGFKDTVEIVQGINRDDVLHKPRYAVKHYRKVLIDLAKAADPQLDELKYTGFEVPIIDPETLVYKKSNTFANFYIDLILRYSKALLAKGELDASINTLQAVLKSDLIYYKLGDAERLSECSRLYATIQDHPQDSINTLKRSINMLRKTFSSIQLNDDYTLQKGSRITNELLHCLNDMAFRYAKMSLNNSLSKKEKERYMNEALAIYLSNLQALNLIRENTETGKTNQRNYPLFDIERENLILQICSLKAHISEIMWYKGLRSNAVSWSEEVLKEIFYDNASSPRVSPILENVIDNMIAMYTKLNQPDEVKRCEGIKLELRFYNKEKEGKGFAGWYDRLIVRWSGVLYDQGPIGIITKPLRENFGPGIRIRDLEEFEGEDELSWYSR